MKTNKLGVVMICALAGLAASCRVVAPHAMFGPTDNPQAKKGGKVQWSSADGQNYDISFAIEDPCKDQTQPIKVISGKIATCTITGMEQNVYPYTVVPAGADPGTSSLKTIHALVVPCHGCGDVAFRRSKLKPFHAGAAVGASASLTKYGTIYVLLDCEGKQGVYTDLCVHTNQSVQWGLTGVSSATITFPSAAETPCVDGNGAVTNIPGDTTMDGTLPMVCSIGPSVTAKKYPYKFTINGGSTLYDASVTVK